MCLHAVLVLESPYDVRLFFINNRGKCQRPECLKANQRVNDLDKELVKLREQLKYVIRVYYSFNIM